MGTGKLATQGFDLLIFFRTSDKGKPHVRLLEAKYKSVTSGIKISIAKLILGTNKPDEFRPLNQKGESVIGKNISKVSRDFMRLVNAQKINFTGVSIQVYSGSAPTYNLNLNPFISFLDRSNLLNFIIDLLNGDKKPVIDIQFECLNYDPTVEMGGKPTSRILGILNDYLYSFCKNNRVAYKWLAQNKIIILQYHEY